MIERINEFPYPFPLPTEARSVGLPQDWQDLSINEQVDTLKVNKIFARPHAFAALSLELAARRMDRRDEALGKTALHLETLTEQWRGERTAQAYEAGVTGGKVMKFEGTGPGGFTGARVVRTFGEDVIDPRIWNDIIGNNRMNGRDIQGKGALLGESTFKAMKFEEWPDSLVALAGLQYLRQSTSKAVKTISSNMLCPDDELPRTKDDPEAISRFWSSKMAGAQNSLGIAYFLGYRDKITPILQGEMRRLWAMNTPIIIKLL